ncbi:MAG: fumarylacetoacetate hydrolase family protein [Chloroflexota bacterium]|nr:fumarylacetoacetate hydrolase family protein [Chloroflexota bacterium]
MKIATYRPIPAHSPDPSIGAVVDGTVVDLRYAYARFVREVDGEERAYELADARIGRDMLAFLAGGERTIDAARHAVDLALAAGDGATGLCGERLAYPLAEVRLLAPIPRPGKILAAGKNYRDHVSEGAAAEGKVAEIQPFPRGFVKVASAVVGPDDPVELTHVTTQLDYEVELAVVIGRRARFVPRGRAYDVVAGYTILNDVSARDIQLAEAKYGNHMIGKNMDTLSPMGPWIVLRDEIPDPMDLDLSLSINGEVRQSSNTRELIHDIPAMVERWSWGTLEPGDVIATGTPAGVALGGKFPYLKAGDVMECYVEGIGRLRNAVVGEDAP